MGGCCCSSRKAQLHGAPVYYYCPPALEEHEALTSHNGVGSELTAGFLVHLDLDTSTPDTYQPPPAPLPYDVVFGCRGSTDSGSSREEAISCSSFKTSAACVELEESDCKAHGNSLDVLPKTLELAKPCELNVLPKEEEDVCPICLEEYDTENPKYVIKCEHYFHLSCILEWVERSDACPICDQEMVFDQTAN
ncbi:E3 ubiquitin-protein ligase [Morus notabilis]|uniref:RING-type E3 ubiquitin transferase n=1 Tax=Morus notabilis TaxID=981085 RepID=W9SCD0_9ROSA|nr:probable E3 ubiquitin-protein ligase RHB1A [Morus notabilis]EXC35098.1 E3 ubiquitin-protein ligase [Morus notabilis]